MFDSGGVYKPDPYLLAVFDDTSRGSMTQVIVATKFHTLVWCGLRISIYDFGFLVVVGDGRLWFPVVVGGRRTISYCWLTLVVMRVGVGVRVRVVLGSTD